MRAPDPASISVVVPTYNDAGRIGDALSSIAGQTLRPGEIVVADDGSDDATAEIVGEFAARHRAQLPVEYVRLSSRSGVVAARNRGISVSRGRWIACCDSDDMWATSKLQRQVEFIRDWHGSRPIALLGTHGWNTNDAKRVISPAVMGPTSEQDYEQLVNAGGIFYVIHSSVLFTRADFDALGGYTVEYGAADDFEFFNRMAERGVVLNLPEPLVYYRKRAGSVQLASFWDKQEGLLRLAENQRRRASGRPPIGRQEFAAQLAAAPARERLRHRRKALGNYYYRMGSADTVNGRRLRGAAELLLSALIDAARVRAGVRNAIRWRLSRR
ncbi:MAG TPA: glycosyltransferase family 2 protein [Solirubrobacteraceae bacterium]|nr:glycosyltransferase family 2 protein [Solirubrobacteraceae bacterium]